MSWPPHNAETLADLLFEKLENEKRRNTIFISCSHKDTKWLNRMQIHLKPLERYVEVQYWDDTMITTRAKWREEIQKVLAASKVAILLVSADFLASDFITMNELPPLLEAAHSEGVIVLPVIVSPSRFQQMGSLSQFQAVNSPAQPLVRMSRGAQEEVFVKVAEIIEKVLHS